MLREQKLETKIELPKTKNMKTAMQELIEWAKVGLTHSKKDYRSAMENLISQADILIEKEKEQIIGAHFEGGKDVSTKDRDDAENFYNQTYNK